VGAQLATIATSGIALLAIVGVAVLAIAAFVIAIATVLRRISAGLTQVIDAVSQIVTTTDPIGGVLESINHDLGRGRGVLEGLLRKKLGAIGALPPPPPAERIVYRRESELPRALEIPERPDVDVAGASIDTPEPAAEPSLVAAEPERGDRSIALDEPERAEAPISSRTSEITPDRIVYHRTFERPPTNHQAAEEPITREHELPPANDRAAAEPAMVSSEITADRIVYRRAPQR
jgi:hypothetical protein